MKKHVTSSVVLIFFTILALVCANLPEVKDWYFALWQNHYNPKNHMCDFYITLFSEGEDGRYERYDEAERERMYTLKTLKRALADTGFEFIGAYSDFAFTEATDNDERIYVIARCKKDGK